jgi:5-methylcytosine-specific restriction endonuclease McrA
VSMSVADRVACQLSRYTGAAYTCHWCGKLLQGRRQNWCSDAHVFEYLDNHDFSRGRMLCLERDRWCCARCGAAMFGEPLDRPMRGQWGGQWVDMDERDFRAVPVLALEVNHRVPVRGRDRSMSCAHHLDNLEALCRPCHNTETRLQILSVRSVAANPYRTIACWEGAHDRCWSTWAPGTVGPPAAAGGAWVVAGCTCECHGFTEPGLVLFT